jgi:hypothetical protein
MNAVALIADGVQLSVFERWLTLGVKIVNRSKDWYEKGALPAHN